MAAPVPTDRPRSVLVPPDPDETSAAPRSTRRHAADREQTRRPHRQPDRPRAREAHERYAIDASDIPRGFDLFWAAETIRGAPNPNLTEYLRAGWEPALAKDFPQQSGFDIWGDESKLKGSLGHFVQSVKGEDPVRDRGLVLLMRPKSISDQARREQREAASGQIDGHMARIGRASARSIGKQRTRVKYGQYEPAGGAFAPDDGETDLEDEE